jgi:hypothetical protein
MDFIEEISAISSRAESQMDHLSTEEATKNALIMPFIDALGYDVFDVQEVEPEFTADVGTKQGEKVDYAIKRDGDPVMLFECKKAGAELSTDHAGQLFRYFHVTEARIGILTNGIRYRFFTDLEEENKMDERPFLEVDILDYSEEEVEELKQMRKSSFDLDEMLSTAHDLKYRKAFLEDLEQQWNQPDDEFLKFMTKRIYDGRVTQRVREQFRPILRDALRQFVSDKISGRLKLAMKEEEEKKPSATGEEEQSTEEPSEEADNIVKKEGDIVTTEEEMEGFRIARAIMREVVDVDRVTPRDVKTYFNVLLDDNNRQPICRLHFNTSQKYLGVFDEEKNEERIPIASVDEIYDYAEKLQRAKDYYDT